MEHRSLGRYEILAEIGKGAMGVVYKARDPLLERTVAIKTINLEMSPEEMAGYEARFYQEAKAAGGLNHPNIVTVYDIGRQSNVAFMAMEHLEGEEVRNLLGGKPLAVEQALDIAAQVAEGLAYAHEHQVVHRDIKPANIMVVRDGLVKITDFGIARVRSADVRTQTGIVMGSPKYMSPEQVRGQRADHRSDIFSLGVVLYEMLTGRAPFEGETVTAIMFGTVNHNPDPPSQLNKAVPEIIDFVVAKALAKKTDERYQGAKEFANDLRECRKAVQGIAAAALAAPRPIAAAAAPAAGAAERVLPRSRRADAEEEAPAATGLSKAFDSGAATLRLATAIGVAGDFEELTRSVKPPEAPPAPAAPEPSAYRIAPTHAQPALLAPQESGWSRDEKLVFAAAIAAALVAAVLIVAV